MGPDQTVRAQTHRDVLERLELEDVVQPREVLSLRGILLDDVVRVDLGMVGTQMTKEVQAVVLGLGGTLTDQPDRLGAGAETLQRPGSGTHELLQVPVRIRREQLQVQGGVLGLEGVVRRDGQCALARCHPAVIGSPPYEIGSAADPAPHGLALVGGGLDPQVRNRVAGGQPPLEVAAEVVLRGELVVARAEGPHGPVRVEADRRRAARPVDAVPTDEVQPGRRQGGVPRRKSAGDHQASGADLQVGDLDAQRRAKGTVDGQCEVAVAIDVREDELPGRVRHGGEAGQRRPPESSEGNAVGQGRVRRDDLGRVARRSLTILRDGDPDRCDRAGFGLVGVGVRGGLGRDHVEVDGRPVSQSRLSRGHDVAGLPGADSDPVVSQEQPHVVEVQHRPGERLEGERPAGLAHVQSDP